MKTISIENAKKLEELGVKRESLFHHETEAALLHFTNGNMLVPRSAFVSAYTADEIGEMLPHKVDNNRAYLVLEKDEVIATRKEAWKCKYEYPGCTASLHKERSDTMADTMAQMLIWLLENGDLKLEEL